MKKKLEEKLLRIAKHHSNGRITTLETGRMSDDDSFHEFAIWHIKEMLEDAYNLGYQDGEMAQ